MVDKVAAQDCHMGPADLPEGVVFSQRLSDRVFQETQVRINYRDRKQWWHGTYLACVGPCNKMEEAIALVRMVRRLVAVLARPPL